LTVPGAAEAGVVDQDLDRETELVDLSLERVAPEVATASTLPALCCGATSDTVPMKAAICPPRRSAIAAAVPRAQTPGRIATSPGALLASPVFFHGRQIVIRATVSESNGLTQVDMSGSAAAAAATSTPRAIYVLWKDRPSRTEGEIRGEFWDIGRLRPDDGAAVTIVAVGTTLPELAAGVVAARRNQPDIAVGNVIGSNVYNILVILGLAVTLAADGIAVAPAVVAFDIPVMIAVALACLPIFVTGYVITRWEGALFVGYYAAYTAYVILASVQHDALPRFSATMLAYVLPLTAVTLLVVYVRAVRQR